MRSRFAERISQKPAVRYVQPYLFRCPAKRGYAENVLYQYHFEQYYWVYARSSVVRAVQIFYEVVDVSEVYGGIYFPQDVVNRD